MLAALAFSLPFPFLCILHTSCILCLEPAMMIVIDLKQDREANKSFSWYWNERLWSQTFLQCWQSTIAIGRAMES